MRAAVTVPATSANLGPGFDTLGLALELFDEVEATLEHSTTGETSTRVTIDGEGAGELPTDDTHLVARTVRTVLDRLDRPAGHLHLRCVNRLPHGRGLGSSAAAIVAGVVLGRALAGLDRDLDGELALAAELEGHPDNVAPCLLGGLTIAWSDDAGTDLAGNGAASLGPAHAVTLPVHPDVVAVVAVPSTAVPTSTARALLPPQVSHADAAANAGRAALLVEALTRRPELLLPATEDRLHQAARGTAMPHTLRLVQTLRDRGVAAVVSGAGPTVLALADRDVLDEVRAAAGTAWTVQRLAVARTGATLRMAADQP